MSFEIFKIRMFFKLLSEGVKEQCFLSSIQGISRVIMSPTELKMQPTIHLEGKAGYLPRPYPALPSKCIVGCIFNSLGFIITLAIQKTYSINC
jgi:hypothetical protein